jgi:hypothetical protein
MTKVEDQENDKVNMETNVNPKGALLPSTRVSSATEWSLLREL